MKCAKCNRGLVPYEMRDGTVEFRHSLLEEDHPPEPIPNVRSDEDLVCDFCSSELGLRAWTFKTAPFVDLSTQRDKASYRDDGKWTACRECKALILAGAWGHLSQHALRALYPRAKKAGMSRRSVRKQITHMHELFKDYWTGEEPVFE